MARRRIWPWVALGAAAIGVVALAGGEAGPEDEPDQDEGQMWPEILHVGKRGDPELEALLQEMQDEFTSAGIRNFTAAEVTKMRKTPGPSYAVPVRAVWPRMVQTLQLAQVIRDDWGKPIRIYNGYRPPEYNAAVGGAKGSQHQGFRALDMLPEGDREAFATLVAGYWIREGAAEKMGFGVYMKRGTITGVHIDTGWRRRSWGSAQHFIEKAAKVATA